jgi:hypothetical protein
MFFWCFALSGDMIIYDGLGPMVPDVSRTLESLFEQGIFGYTERSTTSSNLYSNILISQFLFGLPLPGYHSTTDRLQEQRDIIQAFIGRFNDLLVSFDNDPSFPFDVLRDGHYVVTGV